MPLVPDPKNCDVSVKRAIQGLSNKLGYTGHVTHASLTLSHTGIGDQLTLSKVCTIAAGLNVLRVTGLQTDGVAMTGTLRGAYIDVSNGSTAATGTIRAMELKARTEAPGDTGNDVAVLEGLSISADSKAHSVTTMRAAEFILDGKTAGTIDEAVGLRIANNLQIDKATVSYGLQIYCDSFAYTADIQLSNDATIGISTSGAHLKMNPSGSLGICLPAGTAANERLTIGSNDESELLNIWHSNSHASYRTSKGNHRFQTDEGVNTHCHLSVFGKGTGVGYLNLYDEDSAESLEFRCSLGHAYLDVTGANPGPIHLQDQARSSVRLFANASEGETKELMIYGRRTGDIRRILEIGVGVDADDTASFDGVSNYLFDGAGIFTGLTITGNSVLGLNSAVFQPATDSTTFFQVLDADGGTPIFNVDTTNERVGIGTISPYSGLHYQGDIFYLTPAAGPESNDNITIKNYATGNGAPDIILRTADIAGAYGIGVGTLSLIGGSKTTHYGGIGGGGGKISLQGGQGRDAANDPSYYAPVLLQPTGGNVGIGTTAPNAPLEVKGAKPGVVGGHQSGQLQVTGTGGEFYCAVITGHNSFNGNTQLWYLGNTSSSSHNDIAFINRQNAPIHFYTNNTSRMTIDAAGGVSCAGTFESTGVATFTAGIELGHATDTTIARASAGNLNIEGNLVYRAGGTDVPIADGGTGQSTAQLAINALSAVSGGTNEHVLTKDTASGNAIWKVAAGSSAFTSKCSVYRSGTQAMTSGAYTKIQFNTEDYDINGEFDSSSNYRFQPDANGYYAISSALELSELNDTDIVVIAVYKNGAIWKAGKLTLGVGTGVFVTISCDMYLITTDYIEIWCYHDYGSNRSVGTAGRFTFLDVHRFA